MDKWNNLSMAERSELMRIYRSQGISSLSLMKNHFDNVGYEEWKNSLPENLQDTVDYDLRGAYSSGATPVLEDDGDYHLPSRDPETGKILKKPWHPTYRQAIMEDIKLGYYPEYRNGDTYTNKYPIGGELNTQSVADATYLNKPSLENNSTNIITNYGSNAPKGIGEEAISQVGNWINPITIAASAASVPAYGSLLKTYAKAAATKPITNAFIGAASNSAGPALYLTNRPDKRFKSNIDNKDYLGAMADVAEGALELAPLASVVPTQAIKRAARPITKQAERIMYPSRIQPNSDYNYRDYAVKYLNNLGEYKVPYNPSNKEAFKVAPEFEDFLMETKQAYSPKAVDEFLNRQSRMLRGVKATSPEEARDYLTNIPVNDFGTSRGPGIYTTNSPELAKTFGHKGYIGDLSLNLEPMPTSPLGRLGQYKSYVADVESPFSPQGRNMTNLRYKLNEGDISKDRYIDLARGYGYKAIEGSYGSQSIPPVSERVLYVSPTVNNIYPTEDLIGPNQPVKYGNYFIPQRGNNSSPYRFRELERMNPSKVEAGIKKLMDIEKSRVKKIEDTSEYYKGLQQRIKIGAGATGAAATGYGVYKALGNEKADGGNIYDGESTQNNQMQVTSDIENKAFWDKIIREQPNRLSKSSLYTDSPYANYTPPSFPTIYKPKEIENIIRRTIPLDSTKMNFEHLDADEIIASDREGKLDRFYKTHETALKREGTDFNTILSWGLGDSNPEFALNNPENALKFYNTAKKFDLSDKQIASLMAVSYTETLPKDGKRTPENRNNVWNPGNIQYGTKNTSGIVNAGLFSFEKESADTYPRYLKWLQNNNKKDGYESQIEYYTTVYLKERGVDSIFNNPEATLDQIVEALDKAQGSPTPKAKLFKKNAETLYNRMKTINDKLKNN